MSSHWQVGAAVEMRSNEQKSKRSRVNEDEKVHCVVFGLGKKYTVQWGTVKHF